MLYSGYFSVHPKSFPLQFKGNKNGDYSQLFAPYARVGDHGTVEGYDTFEGRQTADAFVLKALSKIPKGVPVLELGCHTGNNLLALDDSRNPLYGIDLSQGALDNLSRKMRQAGKQHTRVRQWDFAESGTLPPEWGHLKGKLGAIYAVQVFPHMTNRNFIVTLRGLSEYLAPGGIIIFTNFEKAVPGLLEAKLRYGGMHHSRKVVRVACRDLNRAGGRPFGVNETAFAWFQHLPGLRRYMHWYIFQKPKRK